MPQILIRHPKSGHEFEIDSADFRRGKHYRQPGADAQTYEEAGFKIVGLADGGEYTGPLTEPTKPASTSGGASS